MKKRITDVKAVRTRTGLRINVPHRMVLHSPTGMEWGYGGSGPADLALNILLEFTNRKFALSHYQSFKWDFVAKMDRDEATIRASDIREWIAAREPK